MIETTLWQAELEIAAVLQRMTREGGDGNFVIVSAGDYYVQFYGQPGDRTVGCEAVSNAYLSGKRELRLDQINELKRRGFVLDGNFLREFNLDDSDEYQLAQMTVELLQRVYEVAADAMVRVELNLEEADAAR